MSLNHAAHTLLWFRPLSPLQYTLPPSIAQLPWASTLHIPIDSLRPIAVSVDTALRLQSSNTWLLSSPTAAYLAAKKGAPETIAVMGLPTQSAWRQAGGAEPKQWLVSPTGESMGLVTELSQYTDLSVVRGKQGRNDLIETLKTLGLAISTVAIYEKNQHNLFVQNLNTSLNQASLALYLSSTDQPARILDAAQDKIKLLASPLFVSHQRIAAAARELGFQTVTLITI
jgi:uroporphyrinogen-III synthase